MTVGENEGAIPEKMSSCYRDKSDRNSRFLALTLVRVFRACGCASISAEITPTLLGACLQATCNGVSPSLLIIDAAVGQNSRISLIRYGSVPGYPLAI